MKPIRPFLFLFVSLCLAPVLALAQGICPDIVETALNAVDEFCQDAGRNQACYGNVSLESEPQPDVEDFQFEQVGDIVDVADIQSMRLQPMDEEEGVWGVVLMRLQANLPDTLPGQNVTFLLFGDVEIVNNTSEGDDFTPMQAFYLTTGIGDSSCEEAPESGLLVQTPEGVGEVDFNINGVDVAVGSTVLFQAQADGEMTVSPVEGTAVMEIDGELHGAVAGTLLRVPLGPDRRPAGTPPPPEAYNQDRLRPLPIRVMGRQIDIPPPLSAEQAAQVQDRFRNGQPPCGEEPFPPCSHVPVNFIQDRGIPICVPDGQEAPEGVELPSCSELKVCVPEGQPNPENLPSCARLRAPQAPRCVPDHLADRQANPQNLPRCSEAPRREQTPQCVPDDRKDDFPNSDLPLCSELRSEAGREQPQCIPDNRKDDFPNSDLPLCSELRSEAGREPPQCIPDNRKDDFPNSNLPLCSELRDRLPVDDRPCVMRPGPNDPPLPESETRPFCENQGPDRPNREGQAQQPGGGQNTEPPPPPPDGGGNQPPPPPPDGGGNQPPPPPPPPPGG